MCLLGGEFRSVPSCHSGPSLDAASTSSDELQNETRQHPTWTCIGWCEGGNRGTGAGWFLHGKFLSFAVAAFGPEMFKKSTENVGDVFTCGRQPQKTKWTFRESQITRESCRIHWPCHLSFVSLLMRSSDFPDSSKMSVSQNLLGTLKSYSFLLNALVDQKLGGWNILILLLGSIRDGCPANLCITLTLW